MEWTNEDRDALLMFKSTVDSDDIKVKEQIKKVLLNNRFIIHVLGNKELEKADAEPDDYFGVNILPYYLIPDIQHDVECFICYEIGYKELNRYNSYQKTLQITFTVLCHKGAIIEPCTGICRHDLLAALIQNDFNYSTYFGSRIQLVSDIASMTDKHYVLRTLTFEQITDNNAVKTRNKVTALATKDLYEQSKS